MASQQYIVERVSICYRFQRGKYVRDKKRLDVQSTGRYLINRYLDGLLQSPSSSS